MDKENMNKEEETFEYNDEFCEECGCGVDCEDHDHDHSLDEDALVHLVLEDDTELACSVLGIFEVDESEYIALLPIDEKEAEAGVLLYKYIELDEEEFDLVSIEEDEEFEAVSEVFYDLFSEENMEEFDEEYGTYDDLEEDDKEE